MAGRLLRSLLVWDYESRENSMHRSVRKDIGMLKKGGDFQNRIHKVHLLC
jgi:hypothetical protein